MVSNMFYFHPEYWGRWTHFDELFFQMGWFNHQPGPTYRSYFTPFITGDFFTAILQDTRVFFVGWWTPAFWRLWMSFIRRALNERWTLGPSCWLSQWLTFKLKHSYYFIFQSGWVNVWVFWELIPILLAYPCLSSFVYLNSLLLPSIRTT